MAKINLLTIHWGYSNGAVLQTYATVKILEELGHEVSVINLNHPSKYRLNLFKKNTYRYLFTHINYEIFRYKYFPNLTKKRHSIVASELPAADYYVVGSDQVWNKSVTVDSSKSFFLDFITEAKKVSLSSSFGKQVWNEDKKYTAEVKDLLNSCDAVSVRENSGVEICKEVFNVSAVQLIDPTLAYGKFEHLIKDKIQKDNIYSFFINIINNKECILNTIAKELGIPLFKERFMERMFLRSPHKWLENIYNAKFIVTDSFHGLAFSLLFRKQFLVVIGNKQKATRLISLLTLVGLNERVINSLEELKEKIDVLHKSIAFDEIHEILNREMKKYHDFVRQNIK